MAQHGGVFDLFEDTEEGRRIIFQTRLGQSALTNQFNRPFLSNLFPNIQNQFFGQAGSRIEQDQDPISFTDFLNNDFNLDRQIRRTPTFQTGRGRSRFAAPARFLFNA